MKDNIIDLLIAIPISILFLYFLFTNERVQDYMNCTNVPPFARTYETCF